MIFSAKPSYTFSFLYRKLFRSPFNAYSIKYRTLLKTFEKLSLDIFNIKAISYLNSIIAIEMFLIFHLIIHLEVNLYLDKFNY